MAIAQRADEAIASLHRGWVERDERLAVDAEVAARAVQHARDDVGRANEQIVQVERDVHDASPTDALAAGPPAPTGPRIRRGSYLVAIALLFVAEFPLNAVAFRLFGEAEVLTWVMTAGVAATLLFCAHGLGGFLRDQDRTITDRRWTAFLMVVPVVVLVGIAVIRERYLHVTETVTGLQVLGPWVGALVFLAMNLLIYVGATLLSYLAHAPAPPPKRQDPAEVRERALREFRSDRREHEHEARAEDDARTAAVHAREEARRVAAARAQEVRAYHQQLMALYCTANLRARRSPEVPTVLRALPQIPIPAELDRLRVAEVQARGPAGNGLAPDGALASVPGSAR
jgi:uncharacterized membrane protein